MTSEPELSALADLLKVILGTPLRYTRDEVADGAGIPLESARVLWRAMGYADVGEAVAFTEADLDALRTMLELMSHGGIDSDTATDLVRSLGQTTSRLAEWQVNTLTRMMVRSGQIKDGDGLPPEALPLVQEELEPFIARMEPLLVYAWRRQLAAAVSRAAAVGAESPTDSEVRQSVGFADMVGFTRLSRRLPYTELATLVSRFEAVSADVVAASGGRLIKTVGDEILFAAPDPQIAAVIALRLHEAHAEDGSAPEMRIGIATGAVLSRMGDVFGTTVNRASRLTAMAKPGGTLVDPETRTALEEDPRFSLRGQSPRPVRGLGVVRPFSLARAAGTQL